MNNCIQRVLKAATLVTICAAACPVMAQSEGEAIFVNEHVGRAWFGWSVASAGDYNGDGFEDDIVGAAFVSHGSGWGSTGGA